MTRRSFQKAVQDLVIVLKLLFRYAVAPYRWQALKYLTAIAVRNPSRIPDYIQALGSRENLYALREVVIEDLRTERSTSTTMNPPR